MSARHTGTHGALAAPIHSLPCTHFPQPPRCIQHRAHELRPRFSEGGGGQQTETEQLIGRGHSCAGDTVQTSRLRSAPLLLMAWRGRTRGAHQCSISQKAISYGPSCVKISSAPCVFVTQEQKHEMLHTYTHTAGKKGCYLTAPPSLLPSLPSPQYASSHKHVVINKCRPLVLWV